ncbi:MAG TPA: MlaD family protein [Acidimicrobiales bacterium]|jgi:phospholipid/cholesterol/gamma-HCH transport system substrate-binding protein
MTNINVRVRIAALILVFAVGVSYIAFDVLGFRIGSQPFIVTVDLPRGGGLYSDGFVTYRGVDVGRINNLSLDRSGAVATLAIDPGTSIPANAVAHVHELSVAGEQYLDLVPSSDHGPDLHNGSVIGPDHAVVPVSVFQLLNDAGQLIASVKSSEVKTITQALGTGFANTGSDLRALTVAAENLIGALQAARAATDTAIASAGPVLNTAEASSGDIISFSKSLATISGQLAASNAQVNALLSEGVPAEQALEQLIQTDGTSITNLIKDFDGLSDVAIEQQPGVIALLDQLPGFVNKIAATASGGSVSVNINYNDKNTVCPYVSGADTAEPTKATSGANTTRQCTATAPDLLQRGATNAPVSSGG